MSSDSARPALHLPARYLAIVQDILRRYLPHAEVWAYGSRVNGDHYDASDLDLVVRQPDDLTRRQPNLDEVAAAFSDSDLPILVQIVDWAGIPAAFREEIEAGYAVLQAADDASAASTDTHFLAPTLPRGSVVGPLQRPVSTHRLALPGRRDAGASPPAPTLERGRQKNVIPNDDPEHLPEPFSLPRSDVGVSSSSSSGPSQLNAPRPPGRRDAGASRLAPTLERGWQKSEWTASRVADLSNNFDVKRKPVKESDRRHGPFPYYGASGIVDHVDGYLFDGEYLLVAEDGENLRTRQTPIAFLARDKFWVNNHAHIIAANDRADTRFLMYAIRHVDIDAYLTGAVMPKLTQGNLNRIEIIHPPLREQRAIAAILGALDDKIEQNRRTAQALERLARAIFRAWFIDFEPVKAKAADATAFPSMPQPVFDALPTRLKDSEIGPVPEGWEVKTIGEVVTIKGGGTPSTKNPEYWEGGIHCWATPKDMSRLHHPILLDTERRITDAGVERISSGLLPAGTVLMSSRAPVGYLAIAQVPTAINQDFIAMVCDGPVPPTFILNWAFTSMDAIKGRASGTTFPEISKKNFRPLPVIQPSAAVIVAYREIVEPLLELMTAGIYESMQLAQLRDYLLPRLLSGELRVKDAATAAEGLP